MEIKIHKTRKKGDIFRNSKGPLHGVMPPQKVSSKKKRTKEWQHACVHAIASKSHQEVLNRSESWSQMKSSYDLMNNKIDMEDYSSFVHSIPDMKKYVQDPKIKNLNILRTRIQRLESDALSRPFNYVVRAVAGSALDIKTDKLFEVYRKEVVDMLSESVQSGASLPKDKIQDRLTKLMEDTESGPQEVTEEAMGRIMEHLEKTAGFHRADMQAVEHAFRGGKIIYRVDASGGEVSVRAVNPLFFFYEKNPDDPRIGNAQWAVEHRYMTLSDIVDEFHDDLTAQQLDDLDQGFTGMHDLGASMYAVGRGHPGEYNSSHSQISEYNTTGELFNVYYCTWQSYRKIGLLSYIDPEEGYVEDIVDDSFSMTEELREMDADVQWKWVNQQWEGVRVEDNMIIYARPVPGQSVDFWNPKRTRMPYVGEELNTTGTETVSLVSIAKPFQILLNYVGMKIEREMRNSIGKIKTIDFAKMHPDFNTEKTLAWMKGMGIVVTDSTREGIQDTRPAVQTQDDTLSDSVMQLISVAGWLESMIETMIGVTRQSIGQTKPSETATGVKTAITQTTAVHEHLFRKIDQIRRDVRQRALEEQEEQLFQTGSLATVAGDAYAYMRNVDMDVLGSSKYEITITSNQKDLETLDLLRDITLSLVQNQQATIDDVVRAVNTNSVAEASKILKSSYDRMQRMQREAQEAERKAEMAKAQMEQQAKQQEMAFDADQNERDRNNRIEVAQIQAQSRLLDSELKGQVELDKKDADKELKRRELEIKEQDNLSNLQLVREQNKDK